LIARAEVVRGLMSQELRQFYRNNGFEIRQHTNRCPTRPSSDAYRCAAWHAHGHREAHR
jgi:hypothetical protein